MLLAACGTVDVAAALGDYTPESVMYRLKISDPLQLVEILRQQVITERKRAETATMPCSIGPVLSLSVALSDEDSEALAQFHRYWVARAMDAERERDVQMDLKYEANDLAHRLEGQLREQMRHGEKMQAERDEARAELAAVKKSRTCLTFQWETDAQKAEREAVNGGDPFIEAREGESL